MIVFILLEIINCYECEHESVVGVFTTEAKARETAKEYGTGQYLIHIMELDVSIDYQDLNLLSDSIIEFTV